MRLLIAFVIFLLSLCGVWGQGVVEHLSQSHPVESHHSLKPPLDKSQVYWNYGGSTVLAKNFVRLTPSTQDRRGWLWNEYPIESANWESEIRFEVFSKPHFGGDGFGFWVLAGEQDPSFTQNHEALNGPLFGMKADFQGFGVIFDVYDNDGKRNNPSIFVISNPKGGAFKSYKYNHDNDFEDDMVTTKPDALPSLPGASTKDTDWSVTSTKHITHRCVADFRNTGKVSKVLIRYLHSVLHVYIDTSDGMGYKFCLAVRLEEKYLNHHFALSAATGQVADNMDILEITTRYLSDADKDINDASLPQLGAGKVSGPHNTLSALFWFFLSALQFLLILIAYWQYSTLKNMMQARLDPENIAKELNRVVQPHYALHFLATALILLFGSWGTLICNLPLACYRAYQIHKKRYLIDSASLVGAKDHFKTSKISLSNLLIITLANYALLQVYYLYKLFV